MFGLDLQLFAEPVVDTADDVETDIDDGLDDVDPFADDDEEDFWDLGDEAEEAEGDADAPEQPEEEQEPPAEQPTQTPEMNALLAAARRRAEMEAAARAQHEKDALVAQAYAGQVNPYTGRPITTEAELKAYQTAYREEQLQAAGITPDVLQQMIESNPAVQQAKMLAAQQQQMMGQQIMSEQLKAISAIDPQVTSLEDITKMETFEQFDAMVRQGYSLVDAYKLANFDTLAAKRAAAAKQRTLNQTAGKAHLQPTQGKESGQAVIVPPEIREMYREMNPGISDKEIAKHYAKSMKE
jgi:hypothetical protein|nr:MAG TPA: hypothetical protein [Caudoviricetes sp.]